MQVIAGTAKGRRLQAPRGPATRPLSARVKASLFDILGERLEDARVLDLFAGTGQLGIEALSRGAAHATFVELGQQAIEVIRRNLEATGFMAQARVVRQDVFAFIRRPEEEPFTLIFVAPPQYGGMAAKTVEALDGSALLGEECLVVVQQFAKEAMAEGLQRLALVDRRDYGSTSLLFYEVRREPALRAI